MSPVTTSPQRMPRRSQEATLAEFCRESSAVALVRSGDEDGDLPPELIERLAQALARVLVASIRREVKTGVESPR